MNDQDLKETIEKLDLSRKIYAATTKDLNDMIERVKQTTEYKVIEGTRLSAKQNIDDYEAILRTEAVERFEASERTNKKPFPNLGIRVGTKYVYDENRAYTWALENMPAITMLDKKKFEKAIPIVGLEVLGFVEEQEIISATIATEIKLE